MNITSDDEKQVDAKILSIVGKQKPALTEDEQKVMNHIAATNWDFAVTTAVWLAKMRKIKFDALRSAGFTESQALAMLGEI